MTNKVLMAKGYLLCFNYVLSTPVVIINNKSLGKCNVCRFILLDTFFMMRPKSTVPELSIFQKRFLLFFDD